MRRLLTAFAGDKAYVVPTASDKENSDSRPSEAHNAGDARFSDRARRVMVLANREAVRFNHEYIGTEHLLLGLVKDGSGTAAKVLQNLNIDLLKIRLEIEKILQHGPVGDQVLWARRPQTPRARMVIERAIEEARMLNHNYIGTEHLLLGLAREQEGVASQVLLNLGIDLDRLRAEAVKLLSPPS
jgi:ATP-dependent Clp protease ATP-binding subunit ClpC